MKPSEVIEKVSGLIAGRYFENPDKPKTCRTCAIGALIQALPNDKFEQVVSQMEPDDDLKNYDGNPLFFNGKMIDSIPLVQDTLVSEYGLTPIELLALQDLNDSAMRERKVKVLEYLRSIDK